MRSRLRAILVTALFFACGCSSHDTRLYEASDPPRLLDGTIRMSTAWAPGRPDSEDIRVIRARKGKITCSFISPNRGHWVGEAEVGEWASLWNRLLQSKPFTPKRLKVEASDPEGGAYHVITLELGERISSFSSQFRTNVFIFSSRDVTRRIGYSNAIVGFIATHATRRLEDAKNPQEAPADRGRKTP